ncbi:hypothetical protein BCR34DRAFT_613858 [Clohesyomyces aquaticus]|uniref:Uncharacterized protein n=1 Tax=Clohesyomyces aquaticus TaxID=1231657 RepID=A0A1Y1ZQQ3_9PLEO|nr:hypothetical protein BCR34DRAFT_613858 [Clohesyomyces aquaticus]
MCLFTSTATPTVRHSVIDPPPHRSAYSAHPPPGVVRLPRGSTHSYREYRTSNTSLREREPVRLVEYETHGHHGRSSREHHHHHGRSSRELEYYEARPRSSRRSMDAVRNVVGVVGDERVVRGSRGAEVVDMRRSVSRVRERDY